MPFPLSNDRERLLNYAKTNQVHSVDDTEALFGETVRAGFDLVLNEERTDSRDRAFRPHFEARAKLIADLGGDLELAQKYYSSGIDLTLATENMLAKRGFKADRARANPNRTVQAIIQNRDFQARFPGQVLSNDTIAKIVSGELAEKRQANERILARGSGFAGFLGQAAGLVTDPPVLLTLPIGLGANAGRGLLVNAARGFAAEAGIAAAIEIPIQARVLAFKAEIDSPWDFSNAAVNVLSASIGAGALRSIGSVTVDSAGSLLKKYRRVPISARTDESDAAAAILERLVEIETESPFKRLQQGLAAGQQIDPGDVELVTRTHVEALSEARAASEAGESVDVADIVQVREPLNEVDQVQASTLDDVEVFAPGDINVDARRFQFKEGGDDAGVTKSLEGVKRFDRSLAGQILVWENKAGQQFVVDGHQRVGLAKRALEAGQDANEIRLSGFVLRETNGIADIDAMRIGAVRNLTAATGTALDAAKVLRGIGPAGEALLPPLPPNSALLRQGRLLSRLGDDAFNAVVNEVVPSRQAAHVGELIHGNSEQLAALQILARAKPANEVQARAMVEQIRAAGFGRQVTTDLFGDREIANSLIRERAQVIDAAMRTARQDRATFGSLVSRGTSIEGVGVNRLDSGANLAKVEESGKAIEIISRLANQKGKLSEAITEAARKVAAGEKPADVIEPILAAVGRATDLGDTGGRASPDVRGTGTGSRPGVTIETDGDIVTIRDETGEFVIERDTNLSPSDQAVEQRMIDLLADTPWEDLKTQYNGLPESHGGQTMSVDSARELSPDYIADRTLAPAVHEPSSAFIKRLFAERLAEPLKTGEEASVIFTAGGTGAGKTTGLEFIPGRQKAKVILDSNLSKTGSGIKKIDQALAAGNLVIINFVHRDPIESLNNGAFKRAMRQFKEFGTGRTLTIKTHANTHAGSHKTLREIMAHYKDDDRVDFTIIDNSNGKGNALPVSVDDLPKVEENTIIRDGNVALDKAEKDGAINKEIAEGFRGEAAGSATNRPGQTGAGVRGLAKQGRPGQRAGPGAADARQGVTDLLGDDIRAAQALADETSARDLARNTGQNDLETGDPTDLFSAASRQKDLLDTPEAPAAGRPDEGKATGFVTDEEFEATMRAYQLLDDEAGNMVELPGVRVDEAGQQVLEARSARAVMSELQREERALLDIEVCAR